MLKKENYISIFSKFLLVYIIIQPILDLIAGINNNYNSPLIKFNLIFRLLFLTISVLYLVVFCKSKYKKYSIVYLIMITIYFILFLVSTYLKSRNLLFSEFKQLLQYFYFPISLITIFNLNEEENIKNINKYLVISLLLYLILILVPNLLNISFDTYLDGEGSLGLFNSANSISAILSILLPISLIQLKDIKKIILFLILYSICIISIGTKTLILNLILVFIYNFVLIIKKISKNNSRKLIPIIITTIIIIIASGILIIPKTSVYKNINERIEFLKIKNINDAVENFDALVLGRRLFYLKNVNKLYIKCPIHEKVIGMGYHNEINKNVEMDFFDIFYSNGIIGFIIYFIPIIYILKKKIKLKEKNKFIYANKYYTLLLIFLLTLITGHVITEPNVSLFISIILSTFNQK